jgi:hypothetical protein
MAEGKPILNGRLSLAILTGLLLVTGWTLAINGKLGEIQGNLFTNRDGLEIERRIAHTEAIVSAYNIRLESLESRKIPPEVVLQRLDRIEQDLRILALALDKMAQQNNE